MSNKTHFEVVLIWSRQDMAPSNGVVEARKYSAFNRVFKTYPNDAQIENVVAEKQHEIETTDVQNQNPMFHRMELRTVETQDIDLTEIVNSYNATQEPEHDRGCDDGDQDDGC